ncbi:GerMN domain-containing protein [Deinococcus hopiensis]|uniref:Sporulation and spore germination n=1 Tax=Deinococcus hopiensis KR-140 TaxID=695939 RepID=A0A1W1VGA8_9DEIO|nr:GerMN domain-containing protein [Deinococcus hopiensis]SMB92253.1 Sporulation and spore germination [Deinococcus hopiensis KR-140]
MKRLFSLFNVVSAALFAAAAYAYGEVQRPAVTPKPPKLTLEEKRDVKVKVYFTGLQVQTLKPETRTVQVTEETPTSVAQAAVNTWAAGPQTAGLLPAVPKGTPAPKVWLRGQHAYINLPEGYRNLRYGTSGERMLLCTLVRTLLEARGQDVTFLLGGKNTDVLVRMDLGEPYTRQDCTDQ